MKDLRGQLIEKLEELVAFYGKNISDNAVFLSIHHVEASNEDIETGKRLRAEIAELKKQIGDQNSTCNNFHSDPFVNEYKCLNCGKMKSEHQRL